MQFMMDRNFAAEYQKIKYLEDDVWLADGDGFFAKNRPYREHLSTAYNPYMVGESIYL